MRKMNTAEIRELEVINLCGGERLGYTCDFEVDLDCGQILSLIIPVDCGFTPFGKKEEYVIPWGRVECIGEDAILVKIPQSELVHYESFRRGRKRR